MKLYLLVLLVSTQLALIYCGCPKILSKNRWGGRAAKNTQYTSTPLKYVIINHSVSPVCTDEEDCSRRLINMQNHHMNERDFDDIGYNFMVCGDGNIYEGAGWHTVGTHTKGWNSKSLGIGFVGDFSNVVPSSKQLKAGKDLLECAVELGELDDFYKLLGARSVSNTSSPGLSLFQELQNWDGFTRTP